jgi:hypothetical protein
VFPQRLEEGMIRVCSVFGSLLVIFYGEKGLGLQGNPSEFLPFANNIDNGLIPIGLEIADFKITDLSFS